MMQGGHDTESTGDPGHEREEEGAAGLKSVVDVNVGVDGPLASSGNGTTDKVDAPHGAGVGDMNSSPTEASPSQDSSTNHTQDSHYQPTEAQPEQPANHIESTNSQHNDTSIPTESTQPAETQSLATETTQSLTETTPPSSETENTKSLTDTTPTIENSTPPTKETDTQTPTTETITPNMNEAPQIPAELAEKDHIFDHFIVAGIPPYVQNAKRGQFLKPEVLYQFPPDKPVPPKVTEFCFPNGVKIASVKRSNSGSSLNELLYGQPHLHSSSNSHVFYLTGEFQTLYGCCVTKDEFLRCTPNFFQAAINSHPLPQLPQYFTAPRCYCFLSKYPIFPMHFDVLFALLAQDRLITMMLESQALIPPPPLPTPIPSSTPSSDSPSSSSEPQTSTPTSSPPSSQAPLSSTPPTSTSTSTPGSPSTPGGGADDSMESLDQTFQKRLSLSGELFTQLQMKYTYARELNDILAYYYKQDVLQPGQSVLLKIPGDIKKPTTFYCPMAPSVHEAGALQLADWCLTPLFKHLSLENILKIFAGALLEHKFIFLCENLNTLSAAVLSMVPLLFPFVWQGIFIPVLPHNLHEYLDAPVPFIMGLQSLRRRNLEAIIVDLNANKLVFDGCSQPIAMPEYKKLYYNLEANHKILFNLNDKNHNPFNNTGKMLAAVHEIIHTLQAYTFWLIKKIEDFFNANPAEINDSLSVEGFKVKFLATVSGPNKEFVRQFLDTQLFSAYIHSHMGPAPKGRRVPLG